ncbi:MAG: hypothetical protein QHJ73_14125, partial [Armatimonadota bacterium]|nr:hypothetical protein [Armatimonadota bacterium]
VEAAADGRLSIQRLREAAASVRALKRRIASLPPPPPSEEIRALITETGRRIAAESVTAVGRMPVTLDLGSRPLLVICDDLKGRGVEIAEEKAGEQLAGTHPLASVLLQRAPFQVLVFDEAPSAQDLVTLQRQIGSATGVIGATFAHILCYKGDGTRLPAAQAELWRQLANSGKLRAMMLFESPYALADLPAGTPVVLGYGSDEFTLSATVAALMDGKPCPGRLPVTVGRSG